MVMRDAMGILQRQHRRLEEVLASLAAFNDRLGDADSGRSTLRDYTEFFRPYMKLHDLEEDLLFRQIFIHGFPANLGPFADMLGEHQEIRKTCRRLAEVAGGSGALSPKERAEVSREIRGFVSLVREHIRKEDDIVFPMAVLLLPGSVMSELGASFVEFDRETVDGKSIEELETQASSLIRRFPPVPEPAGQVAV
jgi:hemerythrin-like domain-containing protein